MRQDYETRNEWKSGIALRFCEENDVDIFIDDLGLSTRFIMRRHSTGKYTIRLVDTYLLNSLLPSILFNNMLHEIIELEKQM